MTRPTRRARLSRAYFLTEALFVIAMLAVVLNVAAIVLSRSLKSFSHTTSDEDVATSTDVALRRVKTDIRGARAAVVDSGELTLIYRDAPDVHWSLENGHLVRSSGEIDVTLGRDISTFTPRASYEEDTYLVEASVTIERKSDTARDADSIHYVAAMTRIH